MTHKAQAGEVSPPPTEPLLSRQEHDRLVREGLKWVARRRARTMDERYADALAEGRDVECRDLERVDEGNRIVLKNCVEMFDFIVAAARDAGRYQHRNERRRTLAEVNPLYDIGVLVSEALEGSMEDR